MRKAVIALMVIMNIICCSCGNSAQHTTESTSSARESSAEDNSKEDYDYDSWDDAAADEESQSIDDESQILQNEDASEKFELLYAAGVHEDKALIKFKDIQTEENYIGIIDTEGNLKSYFTCDNWYGNMDDKYLYWGYGNRSDWYNAEFENGFIYLLLNGNVYLIDQEGNCLASYPAGYTICFGGGYFMLESHISGFDENKYVYTIVDKDGNEIDNYEVEERLDYDSFAYLGGGVFAYKMWQIDYDQYATHLVYAESGFVGNYRTSDLKDIICADGYIILLSDYISDQESGEDSCGFIYSNLIGDISVIEVDFPEEYLQWPYAPTVCALKNGRILFRNEESYYFTCDIETEEFKKYEGRYADSLNWVNSSRMEQQSYGFAEDGTIAISLKGKDGGDYIGLLNNNMQEVCEPIRASDDFFISDNLLHVKYDYGSYVEVYDLKGNKLFESSELTGFKNFSEGYAVSTDSPTGEPGYITIDGEPAFSINYATGSYVDLIGT